jgi:DNA-binding protein Fis
LATLDEVFREELCTALLAGGHSVGFAATWARLVEGAAQPGTRLLLIDAASPALCPAGARAALLADLAASLPSGPQLRALRGSLPPLDEITSPQVVRLAARLGSAAIAREEVRLLELLGVGRRPLEVLARLSRAALPIFLQGERGSGKLRVANALHALGGGGAFLVHKAGRRLDSGTTPEDVLPRGTLYLPLQSGLPLEEALDLTRQGQALGWRIVVSSREPPPIGSREWARLVLSPLRSRPVDLHALTLLYVDRHRKAIGLPRRRLGKATWALIDAHTWPGNARELETFVASMLSSAPRALILPHHLPPAARAMVVPSVDSAARGAAAALEDLVEAPLRRVVDLFEPGGDLTLHRMVLECAERPLLRAVLARTGGNRKAAAALVGLSRNTFKEHADRLLGGGAG